MWRSFSTWAQSRFCVCSRIQTKALALPAVHQYCTSGHHSHQTAFSSVLRTHHSNAQQLLLLSVIIVKMVCRGYGLPPTVLDMLLSEFNLHGSQAAKSGHDHRRRILVDIVEVRCLHLPCVLMPSFCINQTAQPPATVRLRNHSVIPTATTTH